MKKEEIIVENPNEEKDRLQQEKTQKVLMYQILQNHLEQLKQQGMDIERRYIENETAKQIVGDLNKFKESRDIMIPLGSGCYLEATIKDSKNVIVDMNAGVMSKKPLADVEGMIESRKAEIENESNKVNNEIQDTVKKLNETITEVREISKEESE
jgi:prefoldin alpha subunit